MAAYIIVDAEVTDPAKYEGYKRLTPAAIAKHGGRFIVRGGMHETLEGSWTPHRVVVLEFPSMEAAKRFYASPEYAEAKAARAGAARFNTVVVEGT
ncbi:MAG: DUF1330 domain-containing protein [Alphaproteobacteria bacterium]|nr:DUF1330 domain-containing protein [Alphaproteobacteria bacterium]